MCDLTLTLFKAFIINLVDHTTSSVSVCNQARLRLVLPAKHTFQNPKISSIVWKFIVNNNVIRELYIIDTITSH